MIDASEKTDEKNVWIYFGSGLGAGMLLIVIVIIVLVLIFRRMRATKMEKQESIEINPEYGEDYYCGRSEILDVNEDYCTCSFNT